jgi:hypothetical protein
VLAAEEDYFRKILARLRVTAGVDFTYPGRLICFLIKYAELAMDCCLVPPSLILMLNYDGSG